MSNGDNPFNYSSMIGTEDESNPFVNRKLPFSLGPYNPSSPGYTMPFDYRSTTASSPNFQLSKPPTFDPNTIPGYSNYMSMLNQAPNLSAYHPSKLRALGSILVGLGYGPQAQQSFMMDPYTRAQSAYQQRLQAAQQRLELPLQIQDMQYKNWLMQQQAVADQARAYQEAETGKYRQYQMTPEYAAMMHPAPQEQLHMTGRGLFGLKSGLIPGTEPASEFGVKGIPNDPVLIGPDGKPYKNPFYQPPYHESLKEKEALWDYQVAHPKPTTASGPLAPAPLSAEEKRVQADILSSPKYAKFRPQKGEKGLHMPIEGQISRLWDWAHGRDLPSNGMSPEDKQLLDQYWNDVRAEMQKQYPGRVPWVGPPTTIGKYSVQGADNTDDVSNPE